MSTVSAWIGLMVVMAGIIAAVYLHTSWSDQSGMVRASSPSAASHSDDPGTQEGCADFQDLVNVASDGSYTWEEVRNRLKGMINGHGITLGAKYSEDPGIPEQAQQLLADWTLMDNDAFIRDGAKFIDTCKSYGQ